MDNLILGVVIAGCSLVLFSILIMGATVIGGWLVFKGKAGSEPFLRDNTPGAYSINVDKDEPEFPGQNPAEEHVLKKTEKFLRALGGGK